MNSEELLKKASEISFKKLEEANDSLFNTSDPYRTFIIVHSAQRMIDSGGLVYFFEANFPDNMPYSEFVEAYKKIGAAKGAAIIEGAVASFGFEEPHLHESDRNQFIDRYYDEAAGGVPQWKDSLSGDGSILDNLAEYVEKNIKCFSAV